jgi:alpha-D-glucose phosphate-specific phosphoglucomutase
MTIHFGTSGWRAIIADEFTFANVRLVTEAISRYLKKKSPKDQVKVIVGYDTRFLSADFAYQAGRVLANNGINVLLTKRDTPTPVIAYQVIHQKASGAINITASHNPAEYNGIKFSPSHGGPAEPEVTGEIEKNLRWLSKLRPSKECTLSDKLIKTFDPQREYFSQLKRMVDFRLIRRARLSLAVDCLYGTGRGYLDHLLQEAGCRVEVLHNYREVLFAGHHPEPAKENLDELMRLVRKKKLNLGLALDGDADRFGIVDSDGTYFTANEIFALLFEHLWQTRPKKKTVARTTATTHLIDAIAARVGMEVVETPVGFKYIGQEITKGDCLIGGEESGGISITGHVPEKDGVLVCLLVAELVARKKKPLKAILKSIYQRFGQHHFQRVDLRINPEKVKPWREKIVTAGRTAICGLKVERCDSFDGHRFIFQDGSWILFRLSGTEPLLRVYVEADQIAKTAKLIEWAKSIAPAA